MYTLLIDVQDPLVGELNGTADELFWSLMTRVNSNATNTYRIVDSNTTVPGFELNVLQPMEIDEGGARPAAEPRLVVFALSKVTQDEGMVEFWIILMPVLTYAIGCANARKNQADLRLRLASEMRETSSPESTLSVFDDMVEQGLAPDESAFNKALCACARC